MSKPVLNPASAVINVREYGGAYIARAQGLGIRASCTSGALEAVRVCAHKVFPRREISLRDVTRNTWIVDAGIEVTRG